MRLLYPSDPLNVKRPDENYIDEFTALAGAGLAGHVFSFEDLERGALNIRPVIPEGSSILYRGWMMTPTVYCKLSESVAALGSRLVVTLMAYENCHYLPRWYGTISYLTAETVVLAHGADIEYAATTLGWSRYFVKDFVKSLNTGRDSVAHDPKEITEILRALAKYRGEVEGGVCLRQFEDYIPDSERRYFVASGMAFSDGTDVPEIVKQCVTRISSPFFSVDVAQRVDGIMRVIELGDGQVSDRKHWSVSRFCEMMQRFTRLIDEKDSSD